MKFRDAQAAFDEAIVNGELTTDQTDERYAGKWMYMHSDDVFTWDYFKNVNTREYITVATHRVT